MYNTIYNYIKAYNGLNIREISLPLIYNEVTCRKDNQISNEILSLGKKLNQYKTLRINHVILDKDNKTELFYKVEDLNFKINKPSHIKLSFDVLCCEEVDEKSWFDKALRIEIINIESSELIIAISIAGHFLTDKVPLGIVGEDLTNFHKYKHSNENIDLYYEIMNELKKTLKDYIVSIAEEKSF